VSFVLDSSATLAWCFEDETVPAIDAVMLQVASEGAEVPSLWRFEIANGLQMAVRRNRIDHTYRDRAIATLMSLDIRIDPDGDDYAWTATLGLAALHGLTVYDAAYLELAQRRRSTLVTLDSALLRAANTAGVPVTPQRS
jgi:predicted nucleic acid-binding protein